MCVFVCVLCLCVYVCACACACTCEWVMGVFVRALVRVLAFLRTCGNEIKQDQLFVETVVPARCRVAPIPNTGVHAQKRARSMLSMHMHIW